MSHYTPRERPNHYWYFTSPIGTHEDSFDKGLCEEMAAKVKARHAEKARGDGFEAETLRAYFERHEPEEEETPIPDREYDFARDQEIIADYEATKR